MGGQNFPYSVLEYWTQYWASYLKRGNHNLEQA